MKTSSQSSGALLRLADLTFSYNGGGPVIHGASCEVERSVLTGMIGPNGAGKTTLVRLIRGDLEPTSGSIEFMNDDHRPCERPVVAVVEQHLSLFPDLSVAANICVDCWSSKPLSWFPPAQLKHEAQGVLERLGVDIDLSMPVRSLPYPSRQMVEIGRALHRGADLLILDEPTAGLDVQSRDRLLSVIRALVKDGTTVMLVTHDMDDLRGVADTVLAVKHGLVLPVDVDDYVDDPISGVSEDHTDNHRLDISVRLPAGRKLSLHGRLGNAFVWHFEDALERSLFAQSLATSESEATALVQANGRCFENPSSYVLRRNGVRLLLSDRQSNGLFPDLTVLTNYLAVSGRATGLIDLGDARKHVCEALGRASVTYPSVDAPVSLLSGGNQQRLLWSALADADAQFIVAEEPLWGLDPDARCAALDTFRTLADSGRGVVILTCFPRSYPGHRMQLPERTAA